VNARSLVEAVSGPRRYRCFLILATMVLALAVAAPPPAAGYEPSEPQPCPPPGSAPQPGVDYRAADPAAPNPLAAMRWFVDWTEPAFRQWAHYAQSGKPREAALLAKIASVPRFKWYGVWSAANPYDEQFYALNKSLIPAIWRAQCCSFNWFTGRDDCPDQPSVPLMVVMRHQGKVCDGHYTAGGEAEDERTRRWYDVFAHTVFPFRTVIVFEPDALGTLECLAPSRRAARLRLLRYGAHLLSSLPNATIYLDAGASDWESASRTARQLRYIGIDKVRGFALNTTHYDWTSASIRHGLKISRLTGGKPFIVSTAFNGRGPVHIKAKVRRRWRRLNVWCHPQQRGLGPLPTTVTGNPKVDAFMWIGRPGYSAGSCNGGPLPIGAWWPRRALMLSKYATQWRGPPPGTHQGLFRRYSPRRLGFCGLRCT
jgi:endoglucanase